MTSTAGRSYWEATVQCIQTLVVTMASHLTGSVASANKVGTALKGGMTPPRKTASITSSALRRTCHKHRNNSRISVVAAVFLTQKDHC